MALAVEASDPSPVQRPRLRGALALANLHAALWSAGNGLTTGALIYYLAQELGARGLELSLIIAAPTLVGALRTFTPAIITGLRGVKRTCLISLLASYLLLAAGLPTLAASPGIPRRTALAALIALICVHQLLEYIGQVALWSWLGWLIPPRIRGRYLARRQMWQLAVLIPTLVAGGYFTDQWRKLHERSPALIPAGYALPTGIGAVLLLGSLVPLLGISGPPRAVSAGQRQVQSAPPGASILAPIVDRRFRGLVWYRIWFSFFNGITQAAQNIFPKAVLGFGVLPLQVMTTGMRTGQMAASPLIGPIADRYGNRPVLIVSQALVAGALVFYAVATPAAPWWLAAAWVLWIAYVGTNICQPNLMLKLSPPTNNAGYIALLEAASGVAYGLSTIAGGWLLDRLRSRGASVSLGSLALDAFGLMFLAGVVGRGLGIVWLMRIDEPGAWRWREILRRWTTR